MNSRLLPHLLLLLTLGCVDLSTRPGQAQLALDVLGGEAMAEDMVLNGDLYQSLGTYSKTYMPFDPKMKYPEQVNLQAIVHVRNPFHETINITKVSFDVYSYDPWTRHSHYVTTVVRHISPEAQKFLHIPPYEVRHSPPKAKSLQFHVPYSSLFHPSSLTATPFSSMAAALNLTSAAASEPLSVLAAAPLSDSLRNLELSMLNMDVQATPVPGPLALGAPWAALHLARSIRQRRDSRLQAP
ncbi:MAG: hypothetical protein ACK59A_14585 [Cyanobacteriota bacterium]